MVAQASPVFDRMMNNGMKETEAGVADLPEVEPETFLTFINLAFHAAGAQRDVSELGPLAAINSVVVGPLIVLSIDAGHKHFACRNCDALPELRLANNFPFCINCVDQELGLTGRSGYCTMCH